MNDAVILLCGVILLLAFLPMVLMGRAFKGAGKRKGGEAAAEAKTGHRQGDSGNSRDSRIKDGGGGEK